MPAYIFSSDDGTHYDQDAAVTAADAAAGDLFSCPWPSTAEPVVIGTEELLR